jgi:hypothetical protein
MSGIGLGQGSDDSIAVSNFPVSQAVTGPFLTDAQLRASAVPVSVAGVSTAALQTTGNTSLASIDSKLTAPLAITAATLPLPTGAATSALQTTGNTSLASIDTKTPALGQALAAASVPVVLTAAQIITLTPPAAITGFATSALQTTGNASLASIDAGIPAALGQTTMAASMPVVFASNQSALPVSGTVGITNDPTKLEDAPAASGDRGGFVLGVRNDAAAVVTSTDGDYSQISTDSAGRVGISDLGGSITVDGTLSVGAPVGASVYRNLDVNATGVNIKASSGVVIDIIATNRATAERFLKLYNKATAPTAADTPVMTIPLDGTTGGGQTGVSIDLTSGALFAAGIGVRATTGIADADVGNPSVNNVVLNMTYS